MFSLDPVVMFLNGTELPSLAVFNDPRVPSTLTIMCTGTEEFILTSSNPVLPKPLMPGFYQDIESGIQFSITTSNNLIAMTISNISKLSDLVGSFNCTSLESSAFTKLFLVNGRYNK